MLLNDKQVAIQSCITTAYHNRGLMALGYFLIEIAGISYGVKKTDASMLACSYDSVVRRIHERGKHCVPAVFASLTGLHLGNIFRTVLFSGKQTIEEQILGVSRDELLKIIYENNLLWAPDGDEAFDDGSNIFQFDLENEKVRLLGYKVLENEKIDQTQFTDITISAEEYYGTLAEWSDCFYREWEHELTRNNKAGQPII